MNSYTKEQLEAALQVVTSTILNCEKMQPKFEVGTSQHTLLQNRIKALYISKALLLGEDISGVYSDQDLEKALPPVASIISKSEKGIQKFEVGASSYTRFKKIIDAMSISKALIENEINRK